MILKTTTVTKQSHAHTNKIYNTRALIFNRNFIGGAVRSWCGARGSLCLKFICKDSLGFLFHLRCCNINIFAAFAGTNKAFGIEAKNSVF
jgi:hypothetical protein